MQKNVYIVLGILAAILIVGGIIYYNKKHKSCTAKPDKECKDGYSSICSSATNFEWHCKKDKDDCEGDKPTCKNGSATCVRAKGWKPTWHCPENICSGDIPICSSGTAKCDQNTLKWSCPEHTCVGDAPACDSGDSICNPSTMKWECPPTLVCPDEPTDVCPKKDGVVYNAHCDAQTKYKWVCQPSCDKTDPGLFCKDGKHPGCDIETDYKWSCIDDSSDVCGTTIKPSCSGAMCIDTEEGWDWKCPGDLTRADVIRMHDLSCHDYVNGDTQENIQICFTDSSHNTPINPTIGYKCSDENSTQTLGRDLDNLVANPQGNMDSHNKIFWPFSTDKRIYDQPDTNRPVKCILSLNKSYKCQNGGSFVQNEENVSETGVCKCVTDPKGGMFKGENCQFSNSINCHGRGTVGDDGKCVSCDEPYSGDTCSCSNHVCGHGSINTAVKNKCVCKCDPGYVDSRKSVKNRALARCASKASDTCYSNDECAYTVKCGARGGPHYRKCGD